MHTLIYQIIGFLLGVLGPIWSPPYYYNHWSTARVEAETNVHRLFLPKIQLQSLLTFMLLRWVVRRRQDNKSNFDRTENFHWLISSRQPRTRESASPFSSKLNYLIPPSLLFLFQILRNTSLVFRRGPWETREKELIRKVQWSHNSWAWQGPCCWGRGGGAEVV